MKRLVWFVVVAALIAVALFLLNWEPTHPGEPPAAAHSREAPPERRAPDDVPELTLLPVAESAASLNSSDNTPGDDISILALMVSDYGKILGGNPVGENDEITAALMGKNPKRLGFLPQDGQFLDSSGRLIDRWGTPYFFHALSGSKMEIISAGVDRKHHTEDDITSD